ncbi:MAG: hypothetical protein CMN31_17090, partial [Sandaracinus sp.]|nr:hypothetical protein [Sandaracinus sp.]
MDPIMDPTRKRAPRLLQRLLDRGALRVAGAASLFGGAVGLPLLLACSCPTYREVQVHRLPEDAQYESWEETCEAFCGPDPIDCRGGVASFAAAGEELRTVPDVNGDARQVGPRVIVCEVEIRQHCSMGRRPAGLREGAGAITAAHPLGAHFARAARLEAASVASFVQLAFELEAHGAPEALVRAAERAALDEVDHAARAAAIARRFGATPVAPEVFVPPPRRLEAVLHDDAVEGGVVETYGAAEAAVEARRAEDPALRTALGVIARDEARHAAISTALWAWGAPRLGRAARRRTREAADARRAELAAELE